MHESTRQRVGRILRAREVRRLLACKLRSIKRHLASVTEDHANMWSAQDAETLAHSIARLSEESCDLQSLIERDREEEGDYNPFPPRNVDASHEWAMAVFDRRIYSELTPAGCDTLLAIIRHDIVLWDASTESPVLTRLQKLKATEQELIMTRHKMRNLLVGDLLLKDRRYQPLEEEHRRLRDSLHYARLNAVRKRKAAASREAQASQWREEVKALEAQELKDEEALAHVESLIERLRESLVEQLTHNPGDAA